MKIRVYTISLFLALVAVACLSIASCSEKDVLPDRVDRSSDNPDLEKVLKKSIHMGIMYVDAPDCPVYDFPDEGIGKVTRRVPKDKKFDPGMVYCTDADPCKVEGLLIPRMCGAAKDCWYGGKAIHMNEWNEWVRVDCVKGFRPLFEEGDGPR